MLPFKAFDRQNKVTWIILNYHENNGKGTYLAARDDDSDSDGSLSLLSAQNLEGYKFLGFMDEIDP